MPVMRRSEKKKWPGSFEELLRVMVPQAIQDPVQHENAIEIIDGLMALGPLTKGQAAYLETLVQLVEAYEARHHAVETKRISGVAVLRHLLEENGMNASDLARILGVHVSMGSKILQGDRCLTLRHVQRLARRFKVSPAMFLD